MKRKLTLKIGDYLNNAPDKKHLNEEMFGIIAPQYDFITRLFSFWQDAKWKLGLIAALPVKPEPQCLDLACGTGDIAFLLAKKYPLGDITGLDLTEEMLVLARKVNQHGNVRFVQGDMCQLVMEANSIDIVTGGYALRNAPDLKQAIAEIHRVLKAGGTAAFLDFSKPAAGWTQKLEYFVLKGWTGLWGLILHRNHEVYSYIAESLNSFPDRITLQQMFRDQGFAITFSKLHFLGITETLVVQKNVTP